MKSPAGADLPPRLRLPFWSFENFRTLDNALGPPYAEKQRDPSREDRQPAPPSGLPWVNARTRLARTIATREVAGVGVETGPEHHAAIENQTEWLE